MSSDMRSVPDVKKSKNITVMR